MEQEYHECPKCGNEKCCPREVVDGFSIPTKMVARRTNHYDAYGKFTGYSEYKVEVPVNRTATKQPGSKCAYIYECSLCNHRWE